VKSRLEAKEQEQFFNWLSLAYPNFRKLCFAIPNGGSRHPSEAMNLKKQGVTPGVPDVFCAIQGTLESPGLFVEFKSGKNKLTKLQSEMKDRLEKEGYRYSLCYNWIEAKNDFLEHVGNRGKR